MTRMISSADVSDATLLALRDQGLTPRHIAARTDLLESIVRLRLARFPAGCAHCPRTVTAFDRRGFRGSLLSPEDFCGPCGRPLTARGEALARDGWTQLARLVAREPATGR